MEEKNEIIMENDEMVEVTEENENSGTATGLLVAAGVGLTALVGGLVYKFVAKPLWAKHKAKKLALESESEAEDTQKDQDEE